MRDAPLQRALGPFALAAAIVNITIGGSIFALPASLAASVGSTAPLSFVLGALLFVPIVLCFAAAGSRITTTGGPYAYVTAAFGALPGLLVAAIFWVSSVYGNASMAAILASQLAHAAPVLAAPLPRALLLSGVYGALLALNLAGIRPGALAINIFAAAKAVPLALLAVCGMAFVQLANLRWPATVSAAALGNSLLIVVFAYSGVETALIPSGEVRDPARVVPRAAMAGVVCVVFLYVSLQTVSQGVLGPALPHTGAPLAAVASRMVSGGGMLVVLTATVSLVGVLQGDLLGASRLIYALARDGLLPRGLGRLSARSVPAGGLVAHAAVAWLLAVFGTGFTALALVAGGAFCMVYLGGCAAAWQLQRRGAGLDEGGSAGAAPFVLPGGGLIPLLGIVALLAVLTTLSAPEWRAIGITVFAVGLLYLVARVRRATPP